VAGHTGVPVHSQLTITTKSPKYIFSKLSSEFPYNTRLAESESVRMGPDFQAKLDLTERTFIFISYHYVDLDTQGGQSLDP
jgi:hypothetical protein